MKRALNGEVKWEGIGLAWSQQSHFAQKSKIGDTPLDILPSTFCDAALCRVRSQISVVGVLCEIGDTLLNTFRERRKGNGIHESPLPHGYTSLPLPPVHQSKDPGKTRQQLEKWIG